MKLYHHPSMPFLAASSDGRLFSYVHPLNGGFYLEEPMLVPIVWRLRGGRYEWYLRIALPWQDAGVGPKAARVMFEAYYGRVLPRQKTVRFMNGKACDIHPKNLTLRSAESKKCKAYEIVAAYLKQSPDAKASEIADMTKIPAATVRRSLIYIREREG